jgi:hypothetical protein
MVKKIIDVGIVGNDATGDPIRDAFSKTNDNFTELYAALGNSGGLAFTGLVQAPNHLIADNILITNHNGTSLLQKSLVAGYGLAIDNSDPTKITIINSGARVVSDTQPALGGNLDARGNIIYNLPDPAGYSIIQSSLGLPNQDSFAISKKYAAQNFVPLAGMPATTIANLVIGQFYAIASLGTTTNTQWNIIAGTVGITYAVGSNFYAAVTGSGYGTGTAYNSMSGFLSVPPGATTTQVPQRQEVIGKAGDTMTGALVLAADPDANSSPLQAATKNYVDTTAFASQADFFVSSTGDDYQPTIIESKKGRALAYAFRSLAKACAAAEAVQAAAAEELGPYQKTIVYTVQQVATASTVAAVTQIGTSSGYYLDITHGGLGTDPRAGANYVIRSGILLQGTTSGALAIIDFVGDVTTAPNVERYNIHYINNISFTLGENLSYADPVKKTQITIHIESGEYYEDYPIRIPENVSIVGDELRRVIIRPKANISASKWANTFFRRDITIDSSSPLTLLTPVPVGEFTIGFPYVITSLGSTTNSQWNTIAGTTGVFYVVGSSFVAATTGSVSGNGTAYSVYGYHYLTDPSRPIYSKTISNAGSFANAQKILYANRAFIQAETIGYINDTYTTIITGSNSLSNSFTCISNSNLNVGMPIRFASLSTYGTATTSGANRIRVKSTNGMIEGQTVQFSGTTLGGLLTGSTYYILSVVDSTNIVVSTSYPGVALSLTTDSGIMTVTVTTPLIGGVDSSTTYYVLAKIGSTQFTISNTLSGSTPGAIFNITSSDVGAATMQSNFYYNQSNYSRDIGMLTDAIGFDLLYGKQTKTLEAAISYYSNASGLVTIGDQLPQTSAAIAYMGTLVAYALAENAPPVSYQHTLTPVPQVTFANINSEAGVSTAVTGLVQLMLDIVNRDASFNFPKKNDQMDVFLLNNATILRMFTGQGHGGFMGVLDPEGQILTKSPFIEICASFSKSINAQTFAGGLFVDGFAGSLPCTITSRIDNQTLVVSSAAFTIRAPQTPCSFYLKGIRFEVDYVSGYDSVGGTLTLHLNNNTPDTLVYTNLPTSLLIANTYLDLITAGNRSVVTTHFTNINDLGYTLIATNNALIEAVSLFTYYNFRAFYSTNGAQIRSLNGSNSYGIYGITAEGSDPTEVPSQAYLYYPMTQTAVIYKQGIYSAVGNSGDIIFYVTNYSYIPFAQSGLEIDHNGIIVEYEVNSVTTVDTPGVIQLTLTSSANSSISVGIASSGLLYPVTDGQPVIIRALQNFRFNNVLNVNPIRPSTALVFDNDFDVYRVLQYNTVNLPSQEAILTTSTSYSYVKILVDFTAGTAPGTGQAGDYQINVQQLLSSNDVSSNDVSRVIGKTIAWGTSVHTVVGYEPNTLTGQSYARLFLDTPLSKSLLNNTGSIVITNYVRNTSGVVTITAPNHGLSSLNYVTISNTGVVGIDTAGLYVKVTYINANSFSYQSSSLSAYGPSSGGIVGGISFVGGISVIDLRAGMTNIQYIPVTTISRTSGIATVVTKYPHYLDNTSTVNIIGLTTSTDSNPGFNATNAAVTFIDEYRFTYANAGSDVAPTTAISGVVQQSTSFAVTSISRSNGIATVTTSSAHGLSPGDAISIVDTDFNLVIYGTSSSNNSITITLNYSDGGDRYSITNTTSGLAVGMPIVFTGAGLVGTNIVSGTTYYIKSLVGTTAITISTTPPTGAFTTFILGNVVNAAATAKAGYGFGILNVNLLSASGNTLTYENLAPNQTSVGTLTLAKAIPINPVIARITLYISLTRVTGHDFLSIGTGGFADTKYPNNIYGAPKNSSQTANEVSEIGNGRCFYVSTDQNGNFRVGQYFSVDQGTGVVKFAASIVLTNLDGLGFKRGVAISSFSADDTMLDDAIDEVPTQSAVVGYVNRRLGINPSGVALTLGQIGPGFMPLNGVVPMAANLDIGSHRIVNLSDPVSNSDAATKAFVNSSIASLLSTAGGTMTGNLNMGGKNITNVGGLDMASNKITSLATPTASTDAANKSYVDTTVSSVNTLYKLNDTAIEATLSYTASSAAAPTGSGPYIVVFAIPTQSVAPTTGIGYTVSGNSNSLYNISATATASTVSSITLSYPTNPGAYGTGITTLTTSGLANGDILAWNGSVWVNAAQSGSTSSTFQSIAIAQISRASNIATAVTVSAHGLNTGDRVTIVGLVSNNNTVPGFNGSYVITRVDTVTFTYLNYGSDFTNATAVTGTASATSGTNNFVLLSSTLNISVNSPIVFTGSTIGNILAKQQYWVKSITTQTVIPIAEVAKSGYTVTINTGAVPFTLNSFTSKILQGDNTYRVTFAINVNPAPAAGVSYLILGNSNSNYNGTFVAYSASTVSITLTYPTDPGVYGVGTTTAQYLAPHGLTNGQVVTISGTGIVDQTNATVTVINGTQFTYTQSTSATITGTIVTGIATPQPQITLSTTPGGAVITQVAASGTMSFTAVVDGFAQIFSNSINSGVITNSMISAIAAIDQSKLNLSKATAGLNTGPSPVTFGIAAFSSNNFTASSGFISLASNGITLSNLAAINSGNVLGNISGSTGNVNSVPVDTASTANTLVLRDSSGNFSAGIITASLSGNASTATNLAGTQQPNYFYAGPASGTTPNSAGWRSIVAADLPTAIAGTSGTGSKGAVIPDGSTITITNGVISSITGAAAAGSLTGATLASNVLASSLTSVGTLTGLTVSGAIAPNATGTINLGSSSAYWNNAYINTLNIGTTILPNASGTLNIGSSSFTWNTIYGNATSANYADLAENYEGDKSYEVGTVVMIGGEKEVTQAIGFGTTKVAGVVSENPAHLMNANCPGIKVPVALTGRVPCKVVGKIAKGDLLVVGLVPGVAQSSADPKPGSIIGKALADYDSDRIGLIEVLVGKH